ncbi:MAG: hypothetical protein ACLUD2_10530 [Clostridium sp.]
MKELEAMSSGGAFRLLAGRALQRIRCNACRNVCPACSCNKCVFDSDRFDTAQKANADTFEEQMFHLIRAFHVAGRCTGLRRVQPCMSAGHPASSAEPEVNQGYRMSSTETYQAGEDAEARAPLTALHDGRR